MEDKSKMKTYLPGGGGGGGGGVKGGKGGKGEVKTNLLPYFLGRGWFRALCDVINEPSGFFFFFFSFLISHFLFLMFDSFLFHIFFYFSLFYYFFFRSKITRQIRPF